MSNRSSCSLSSSCESPSRASGSNYSGSCRTWRMSPCNSAKALEATARGLSASQYIACRRGVTCLQRIGPGCNVFAHVQRIASISEAATIYAASRHGNVSPSRFQSAGSLDYIARRHTTKSQLANQPAAFCHSLALAGINGQRVPTRSTRKNHDVPESCQWHDRGPFFTRHNP